MEGLETDNHYREVMLNMQKSAEVIVAQSVKDRINRSPEYDRERRDDLSTQKTRKKETVRKETARNVKGMRKCAGHSI